MTKDHGITIFLSRLQIVIGGAVDFNGQPRTFSGATVTANEASAAAAFGSIFEYLIPGLESQPGLLKTLFTRDINVTLAPSPRQIAEIPTDHTIVAVGSPGYNCVSLWIQQSLNPLITFDANNTSLQPHGQAPVIDPTQGMVQVLWDANNQRRVFYVGGISEAGTIAALMYLATNWRELRQNLGRRDTYAGLVRIQNGRSVLLSTIHAN